MEDLHVIIGSNVGITWWQMIIRAILVFFITLCVIRIGKTRMFGKYSAFDIVIGIVLGSILSRAITGNSPFVPTICAALVLILLHMCLGFLAFRFPKVGWLIKGREKCLVKDGEIQNEQMKTSQITINDLREAIRNKGLNDINEVGFAFQERSGTISVIRKAKST